LSKLEREFLGKRGRSISKWPGLGDYL